MDELHLWSFVSLLASLVYDNKVPLELIMIVFSFFQKQSRV